mgnify:CR=1 FL=1
MKEKRHIKFTKNDIRNIYLTSSRYDTWALITLKSGTEIRSHSTELESLILGKHKSYVAFLAIKYFWLSHNNGEDFSDNTIDPPVTDTTV